MLWVKDTVLTLMERSQPSCWPHCLQCSLATAQTSALLHARSRASGAEVPENGPQNPTKSPSICLLKPFPSFLPAKCHVPTGLGTAMAPGIVARPLGVSWGQPGSFSRSVGCKGCAALPAHTVGHGLPIVVHPSPIMVPSISHLGAEAHFSPLLQRPWRQC